ncbi:MAG TPA: PEPxxWA-CTERM sorting domain-containing protein [Phenylobacterium sp.]|jgi:hypothetical protein|nr:PEPxxWA-CTERM sorting domain-containing protein [Phenylobacterium sp.]
MLLDRLKAVGVATSLAFTLAAAPGFAAAGTNLVANGGFETGDFSGWTTNAVSYPQNIVSNPVRDGLFAAQIEGYAHGPNTLSQLVSTTSGQSYSLSFWYLQSAYVPNGLSVSWNGSNIFSSTNELLGAYQQFSATVLGSGSDALVFTAYNDSSFTFLDAVSVFGAVSAVPEPATWAMMIVGFGAAGSMARRSRRNRMSLAV